MIMKKLLLLAAVLLCGGSTFAQTMMEIPGEKRFHAMSENGKYMLTYETGYIGIYNTETNEFFDYDDPNVAYDLGMGNMVTNDGFLVGDVNGTPSILDIENKTWTPLGMKEDDAGKYSCANGITPSRKYIIGYVGTGDQKFDALLNKPVIWTQNSDGSYGVYEELPYPAADYTGIKPKNILPNCISEDGTVIAAQMVTQENNCLPLVYRKAQDGTWTYELYENDLCEPGTVFPERPTEEPIAPDFRDYMTAESYAAYHQDSIEYKDSLWAWTIGDCPTKPYYPDERYYMTEEKATQYDDDWAAYQTKNSAFMEQLSEYRYFLYENVTPNFYTQNGVWLSANGKYYAASEKDWSVAGNSVLFTIGETLKEQKYKDGLYGYCVDNDGNFFVSDQGTAYVYPAGSTERVTLPDFLRSKGETEAADWLDNVVTGTAICSSDGRVISGFSGGGGVYSSWIIKLDGVSTGITDVDAEGNAQVKVYDLQGRFIGEGPEGEVTKGLKRGVYIVGNRKVVVR